MLFPPKSDRPLVCPGPAWVGADASGGRARSWRGIDCVSGDSEGGRLEGSCGGRDILMEAVHASVYLDGVLLARWCGLKGVYSMLLCSLVDIHHVVWRRYVYL